MKLTVLTANYDKGCRRKFQLCTFIVRAITTIPIGNTPTLFGESIVRKLMKYPAVFFTRSKAECLNSAAIKEFVKKGLFFETLFFKVEQLFGHLCS